MKFKHLVFDPYFQDMPNWYILENMSAGTKDRKTSDQPMHVSTRTL